MKTNDTPRSVYRLVESFRRSLRYQVQMSWFDAVKETAEHMDEAYRYRKGEAQSNYRQSIVMAFATAAVLVGSAAYSAWQFRKVDDVSRRVEGVQRELSDGSAVIVSGNRTLVVNDEHGSDIHAKCHLFHVSELNHDPGEKPLATFTIPEGCTPLPPAVVGKLNGLDGPGLR